MNRKAFLFVDIQGDYVDMDISEDEWRSKTEEEQQQLINEYKPGLAEFYVSFINDEGA